MNYCLKQFQTNLKELRHLDIKYLTLRAIFRPKGVMLQDTGAQGSLCWTSTSDYIILSLKKAKKGSDNFGVESDR